MINNNWIKYIDFFNKNIRKLAIDNSLSLNDQRIIRFINLGAVLCGIFCLIVAVLTSTFSFSIEVISWLLGLVICYSLIPLLNRLKLLNFSKFFTLTFFSGVIISWNLIMAATPYFLILPFAVAFIFYPKFYTRILSLCLFFAAFYTLKYHPLDYNMLDLIGYDFFLFCSIILLIGFTEENIKSYEKEMCNLYGELADKNEALKVQQKFRESEQFFRSFFENSQLGFVVIDRNGDFKRINPAFCKQLGYSLDELLNFNLFDINKLHIDFSQKFQDIIKGAINSFEIDGRFIRTDESTMESSLIVNGVYDAKGDFWEAIITIQDVTESYYAQKNIRQSEAKFRTLFDLSPVGITIIDLKTNKVTGINQNALDFLGLTKKELSMLELNEIVSEKTDIEADRQLLEPLLNGEVRAIESEKIFKSKSGEDIYVKIIRSHIKIDDEVFGVGISLDITESKKIEQERKVRYQEMQTFFDALPISFLYLDNNNKILRANRISAGGNPDRIEGRHIRDVYPTFTDENAIMHQGIKQTGESLLNEIERYQISNQTIWMKVDRIPVKDDDGNVSGIIVFSTDITEIKKTEGELAVKNSELEHYIETNLQLESFAYIASHDLKEPLRMIHSFTQLLNRRLKNHFDESSTQYMNFILDGVNRMQNLLDDLLKFSTIGLKETDKELTDLNDTIYNVIQNVQHTIKEKSAEITIEPLPSLKVFPIQMVQLFQNIISNALKFISDDKKPFIEISVIEKEEEYIFSIKDNGIGIKEEYMQKIFLVFKQLHGKMEYEGTGIGLATCKKIIDNLGGKIWVESEYGSGTTFFFSIPK